MPSKVRESDHDRPRESPKRETSRHEKREHHKSSHRKSSATKDRERPSDRASTSTYTSKRRSSLPSAIQSDELSPLTTMNSSKTSLPYPSFSKAHSKEAVGALKENLRQDILTPDSTDISASRKKLEELNTTKHSHPRAAPPSPPLTNVDQESQKKSSNPRAAHVESLIEERSSGSDEKVKVKIRHKASRSTGNLRASSDVGSNRSGSGTPRKASPSTPAKSRLREKTTTPQRSASQPQRPTSIVSSSSVTIETSPSSDATSIAPNQTSTQRPASVPVGMEWPPPATLQHRRPSNIFVVPEASSPGFGVSPQPPPPPPPPVPLSIPRVDYLLKNGGLPHVVPRNLLLANKPVAVQQGSSEPKQQHITVANLFEPYNSLLDNYEAVVTKNGSLAVATGYRSVARRLLDRLEVVFARDISSEACECSMCDSEQEPVDDRGVSWGEILELVSGRRDLPPWPPFAFVPSSPGLGISLEAHIPMQKLDIDVPEEYREHYIRQSKKTKHSVDRWLSRQSTAPTSPPSDVDDETLIFAIITHLDPQSRPTYASLLGLNMSVFNAPDTAPTPQRGPTPAQQPPEERQRSEPLAAAGKAIQRLYRLADMPRDPETAIFLLNSPDLHNPLATLAAVSNDEWEILISGRFDGFLRSGADDFPPLSTTPSNRPLSRSSHMHGSTPFQGDSTQSFPQHGAPIAFDEEMEIATLAEIERDIYLGMEALEDAFESLHIKAETIRIALRQRGAGLAVAAQRRRGVQQDGIEVRTGTPASNLGDRWEAETDDGLGEWDGRSEIAPDDSASNISSSRRRRPKRRTERRTPAPVSEEDEGSDGTASPRKR